MLDRATRAGHHRWLMNALLWVRALFCFAVVLFDPRLACADALAAAAGKAQEAIGKEGTPRLKEIAAKLGERPDDPELLHQRGHVYALLGLKPQALADLGRAVELAPADYMLLQSVGWSYFNLREFQRALDIWWKAARLNEFGRSSDAYTVALGCWGVGDRKTAAYYYQLAVDEEAVFAKAASMIERTRLWTSFEKQAIHEVFDAWQRGYRPRAEPAKE